MTDIVIMLTTVPTLESAETIARALIEARLAACVNILPPMTSVYRWQGQVARETELQLIIKTTTPRVSDVRAMVARLHPYQLPECLVCPVVDGSSAYLAWVRGETESSPA